MGMALRIARGAARAVVDFALPPRCPGCGTVTDRDHSFCLPCWESLDFLGEPCCPRCALPLPYDAGGGECGGCRADPPAFDRMRAAVAYGPVARRVVLKLKYSGRPGVAATLAHFMLRHVQPAGDAIIAPVPLHRWRMWKRGYNQSALIASALAARSGLPVELDLVRRVKPTRILRGLGRRERALAVRGAFKVADERRGLVAGRSVLLVDDVFTTGATASACARTLKRSGAAEVNILCWARVVSDKES